MISFTFSNAFATDQIFITKSEDIHEVIFDGKWTHLREWKRSSLDSLHYENGVIQLRSAHHGDYIYIMLNVVSDIHPDKGQDRAILCFDSNNDKSTIADENDYCFFEPGHVCLSEFGRSVAVTGSPLKVAH